MDRNLSIRKQPSKTLSYKNQLDYCKSPSNSLSLDLNTEFITNDLSGDKCPSLLRHVVPIDFDKQLVIKPDKIGLQYLDLFDCDSQDLEVKMEMPKLGLESHMDSAVTKATS